MSSIRKHNGRFLRVVTVSMLLSLGGMKAVADDSVSGQDTHHKGGNLLVNADFESGYEGRPDGWGVYSTGDALFFWDYTRKVSGQYSVKIEMPGQGFGVWLQNVDVTPGVVYTLSGQVAFENIVAPGRCNLRVLFRDGSGGMLEIIDLSGHDGTRGFELDFPYAMKFRAPDGAATAEINACLQGPGTAWFDDLFFGAAPVGRIVGQVTSHGRPLPGARVWVSGDPWHKVCEAFTDANGRYVIGGLPVAFPRYIVLAEKQGYRTVPAGDLAIFAGEDTEVDFELIRGSDPIDDLRVKYGFLEQVDFVLPLQVPTDAVIPDDVFDYPASVLEYLGSDVYITPDDPAILALRDQIFAEIDPADRSDTYTVAWAVYEWISRNINHDAVFSPGTLDVTSGIFQTIQGGWCWGQNFYDWCYKPAETLQAKCAICIEHSWLASSLLRSLDIPARARVGSAEFWVQKPGEYGYWVGLSTNGGSNAYREHGTLGQGFGGMPTPANYSVTSEPFLAEDWNAHNKGLWHETHPWGESYPATSTGYVQALMDMITFETTGEAPLGMGSPMGTDTYKIHYSDITVNLDTMGRQRVLDVRFPMSTEYGFHYDMDRQAWWTNHPECVLDTWVEEIVNPPVNGVQQWYHIEFDVTSLLSLGDGDGDGDVDLADYAAFQRCFGSDRPECVGVFDFNGDGEIGLEDYKGFAGRMDTPRRGPND